MNSTADLLVLAESSGGTGSVNLSHQLIALLIALVSSAIFAYPILRGLIALKSRQTVSQFVAEHAHKQGTPTMGGLIILVGALAGVAYWAYQSGLAKALPTLALMAGYGLIGFVDDFVLPRVKKGSRGLGWIPKLVLQIGIASIAVWIGQPNGSGAFAFTVFLILFFSNAYNFSDGLDWLAGSILLALGGTLAVASWMLGQYEWLFPMLSILGGLIPFMVLNKPPAKVFMGDVGSMAIGGFLGQMFAGLLSANNVPKISVFYDRDPSLLVWSGLALFTVVMLIEIVPPPLQILSVKLRKKKLFSFTPVHHAYQRAGWPEIRIVGMFFGIQIVCSLIGLFLIYQGLQ